MAITPCSLTVRIDSIPEGYVLIRRSAIDRANADTEICDFLRTQLPEIRTVKDLYKHGLGMAMKMDTIQENRNRLNGQIIILTNENLKAVKKQLRKNWFQDVVEKVEEPVAFVLGVLFGGVVTRSIMNQ